MNKKSTSKTILLISLPLLLGASLFLVVVILASNQLNLEPSQENHQEPTPNFHEGLIYYSASRNSPGYAGIEFGGLYFFDLVNGETTELTPGSTVSQYERPSWSRATKTLVYTTRGEDVFNESLMELYSFDFNGSRTQLTDNNYRERVAFIAPDGQTIAFWSGRPDNHWIYLMDSDGSNIRPFFEQDSQPEFGFGPLSWSPNSQKIAITIRLPEEYFPIDVNDVEDSFEVFDVHSRQSLLSLPTDRVRVAYSWSPDSKKLVYLSTPIEVGFQQKYYTTLYLVDIDTQKETRLVGFAGIGHPLWSPVEDIIAFTASTEEELDSSGEFNVYLINSDGTNLRQLTDDGFFSMGSWSPDGSQLALEYIGEQLTEDEIYILDIDSGALEQFTDNNVLDAHPIWVELE